MFCLLTSSLSDTWYFKWFVAGEGWNVGRNMKDLKKMLSEIDGI